MPQIRDGPITLRLPNSRFVHWLYLSAMESDNLSLELPQRLLFTNGVLAVESLAPNHDLHLLFHIGELLKDLTFE